MSEGSGSPLVPAATLMLLRDGADGIEVLMTVRHMGAGFAAGAMVFPGGQIDGGDRALIPLCRKLPGLDDDAIALRIGAVRESFEESGILLARQSGSRMLMSDAAPVSDFAAAVEKREIEPAIELLVPFAHWITPPVRPKRFDTHFFLAPAPEGQHAKHDGLEMTEVVWTTPNAAIRDGEAGKRNVVFPTYMQLLKLARHRTVAEALEAARNSKIVTVSPGRTETSEGAMLTIPEAAGYGVSQMLASRFNR